MQPLDLVGYQEKRPDCSQASVPIFWQRLLRDLVELTLTKVIGITDGQLCQELLPVLILIDICSKPCAFHLMSWQASSELLDDTVPLLFLLRFQTTAHLGT